jgi:hypothetical protein
MGGRWVHAAVMAHTLRVLQRWHTGGRGQACGCIGRSKGLVSCCGGRATRIAELEAEVAMYAEELGRQARINAALGSRAAHAEAAAHGALEQANQAVRVMHEMRSSHNGMPPWRALAMRAACDAAVPSRRLCVLASARGSVPAFCLPARMLLHVCWPLPALLGPHMPCG